jgi:hypothetical protein
MNSMRAAVLWAHLLRGAAPHDSPLDTLVAASRGTAHRIHCRLGATPR